jgi:Tfp pilus assembly protein PilV
MNKFSKNIHAKSSRTQRSEKKKMNMFSKNLVKSSRMQRSKKKKIERLVKGTYLVEGSRTQRSNKKMNILSKELTWWKAQELKGAARRRR